MPGAEVIAGSCRHFVPPPTQEVVPTFQASADAQGVVRLAWERSARTIGLKAEVHRSAQENFTPDENTLLVRTPQFQYVDRRPPAQKQYYALILTSDDQHSKPAYAAVSVPKPTPPPTPKD